MAYVFLDVDVMVVYTTIHRVMQSTSEVYSSDYFQQKIIVWKHRVICKCTVTLIMVKVKNLRPLKFTESLKCKYFPTKFNGRQGFYACLKYNKIENHICVKVHKKEHKIKFSLKFLLLEKYLFLNILLVRTNSSKNMLRSFPLQLIILEIL